MFPRLDIIEDQFFRKSIPKSTRLYKFRKNFISDMSSKNEVPSGIKFMKAVIKDGLYEARERDVKYSLRTDMPRKKTVLDTKVSNSTTVSKSSVYSQTKDKIFGGQQLKLPEGTPLIDLLKLLNED